jgi:diguanylate cyclase (GGDEF)-like protein
MMSYDMPQDLEKFFRELTEKTQEVFWQMTPSLNKISYINQAFQKIWHRTCDELVLNPSLFFDAIVEKDREAVRKLFLQDKNSCAVFQLRRPDGSLRKIYSRSYLQLDGAGKIESKIGFATDITDYEKSKQRTALQDDIIKTLSFAKSLTKASSKILEIICIALDCQVGEIWLLNKGKSSMYCISNWAANVKLAGIINKRLETTIKEDNELPGKIWQKNQSQWASQFPIKDLSLFYTAFGVPIRSQNEVIGILLFFSEEQLLKDEHLLHVLEAIGGELGKFITQLYSPEKLSYLLEHDSLTDFLNRHHFIEDLNKQISQKSDFFPLLLFRVDRFDLLLESLGHDACDDLLQLMANKIRHNLLCSTDLPARVSVDTFALALPSLKSIEQVNYFVSRLNSIFSTPLIVKSREVIVTISIGASLFPQNGLNAEELLANAAVALEHAEEHGGNSFIIFSQQERSFALNKLELETQLRTALLERQFILYYQPQFNIHTGAIVGCESLIRWQNPERGLIGPLEFLPILEQSDLIANVGEWVLREVCQQINRLQIQMAVNLSIYQFRPKFNLVNFLQQLIKETGIDPQLLNLEVTEGLLIRDIAEHFETLEGLKNLSVRLSLEDFGTGYSSLNYLKQFPVNKVKVEKSFIDGLPNDKNSKAITAAIIALTHGLGITVIAEGVENKEQFEFLQQAGCDEIQGYYYAKPMPIEELEALILKSRGH